MANSEIIDFPLLTALTGAQLYGVKNDTDYRIKVGEANGLATLDATGKLPAGQAPATLWGTITGTLSNQLDLQAALNGKQAVGSYAAAVHTHAAGDITSGTMSTARLGSGTASASTWLRGDGTWATIPAAAATTWGSITGTLSNQTDLQTALNGKQASDADLTAIAGLAGTSGFLKKTAANTWTLDTSTYLTGNQAITLSGDVSGSGTTSIAVTVADDSHNHIISNVDGLQTALDAKLDDSQATATGLAVLGAASQDAARDAIGVYVQAGDPGAVADGSLWIW